MKKKYITVDFHFFNNLWREFEDKYNINAAYWVPDRFLKIIDFLEEKYPDYQYHSFNPAGSGGYQPFVILKLKQAKLSCEHKNNFRSHKYVLTDGTPMIDFICYDCGYVDEGHVYGDSEGWKELTIVRDGKIILQEN